MKKKTETETGRETERETEGHRRIHRREGQRREVGAGRAVTGQGQTDSGHRE